jgi:hypothetical protein
VQIQEMARMTPGQRLELLKEVGGTRVYEERRKESIKIMGETEARRTQVGFGAAADWLCMVTEYCLAAGSFMQRHSG